MVMLILGIWDGHDAGAAIVEGNEIKVAVNEERLSRRKLDVGFPFRSIKACLDYLGLKPTDIEHVGITTTDPAKTLTRIFPSLKEKYYLIRRRKIYPRFGEMQKLWKYRLTQFKPNLFSQKISEWLIKKSLKKMGFENVKVHIVDHHMAHAATAAFCSGFERACVVTLDGVGDGLSGSINVFESGELKRIKPIPAKDSLGIFFEHVTNLLGMRELEDEGKVMALADFAYPVPDEKNPLLRFFEIDGTNIKAKYSWTKMYKELKKVLWFTPREQFAWMAQRTLEFFVTKLFTNVVREIGINNVAWSGGIAANIKANMKIRKLPEVKDWFVFPHMGDGGLALGAAMVVNYELNGISKYRFNDVYFGLEYSDSFIEEELKKFEMKYEFEKEIEKRAADLISDGNIIFLFQGRMEYGPRALGNRSILALPNSLEVKDTLNIRVKKRAWFQPFCPSMIEEDAKEMLEDYDKPSKFMTMGYMVKENMREKLKGVINIDGSARPQVVTDENVKYRRLIECVKKRIGIGAVLNTSFNIHGEPIVCSPRDAIETMLKTKNKFMVLGNYLVELGE